MYLMIDNYDSFTYNLYALFRECNAQVKVIKNNEYIPADDYEGIILSPGPSSPENSGTTLEYLEKYTGIKPIFGVCLGMQSIGYSLGYKIIKAKTVKHGKVDEITVKENSVLFKGLPKNFKVVRYHSLAVDIDNDLVTSYSNNDNVVMSIEDPEQNIFGVQFHPESILSENGKIVIKNFMEHADTYNAKIFPVMNSIQGDIQMEKLIQKVNSAENISYAEAKNLFEAMVTDKLTEAQIAAALISIKHRGETVNELAALVEVLNKHKKSLPLSATDSVDTCGTGGDGKSTVNVSTAVSVILAAMGYPVVKHGNKAQTGKVGSADILMDLGLDINYTNSSAEDFFNKHNFVFMMAPLYHPALKGIGKVRRELKVATIFNYVGPLVNPAHPQFQVIGINKRNKLEFIAETILKLGKNNITVYSSFDGFDEISSKDKTECITIRNKEIERYLIDPADYFEPFDMPIVHDNNEAKKMFLAGIDGTDEKIVNIFAINTAIALKTMKKYELKEGFDTVKEQILAGTVKKKLDEICGK